MVEVICAAIAAASGIAVAVIGRNAAKQSKRAEEHAEARRRESLLSLRMMDATLQLSVVTSNALTGGHNNGNVERAREAAQKVGNEYTKFMQELTAQEVAN